MDQAPELRLEEFGHVLPEEIRAHGYPTHVMNLSFGPLN